MWVFLNDAFLSIVASPDPHLLTVRARFEDDIERVFPGHAVSIDAGTDYRFRAHVPRQQVADVIADDIADIRYTNFKNSVIDDDRHAVYLSVWAVMCTEQEKRYGRTNRQDQEAPRPRRQKQRRNGG